MPPSWHLARNALAGRRGRTGLLAGTIALAAALVVGLVSASETLQASVDARVREFIGAADARLVHPAAERFDAAWLDAVRGWPGLEYASGRLVLSAAIGRGDRGTDPESGFPRRVTARAIGVDLELEPVMRPRLMAEGRFPESPEEVLLDPLTAEALGVGPGDEIEILRLTGSTRFRVSGIYERKTLGAFQTPRAILDRDALGTAMGVPGTLTSVNIALPEGTDVQAFCDRHAGAVEAPLRLEPTEAVRAGLDERVRAGRVVQLAATALAFLAAALLIVTGLTAGITERERELALLRCIGASRSQLFLAQLGAGVILALIGAAIGVPLGLALTAILVHVFDAVLPSGLVVPWRAPALAVVGALSAGVLGALAPAVGASSVPPLRMLARSAVPPRRRSMVACVIAGLGLVALQQVLLTIDDRDARFWAWLAVGLPALVLGHFILAVPLLVLVARTVGPWLARGLRLPADALRAALAATPYRFGFTAGALMLGMVVLVDAWGSATATLTDWIGDVRFADAFCYRITGITSEEQDAIAAVEGVAETCPIGYLPVRVAGQQVFGITGLSSPNVICVGFDPDRFLAMNAIEWREGTPEAALPPLRAGTGAIVAERFLEARGLGVGDTITLESGDSAATFTIEGVVTSAGLDVVTQLFGIRTAYLEHAISCVFVDDARVAEAFGATDAMLLQIDLEEDANDDEVGHRIEAVAPGVGFRSGRWIGATIEEIGGTMRLVQSTVAIGAMLLAALAAANVLAASVQARRFELGVLRAVGGSRFTVTRLVLGEATLVALTGAIAGTALGMQVTEVGARHLHDLLGLARVRVVPVAAAVIGGAGLVAITLAVSLPIVIRLVRLPVSAMLAVRRDG